MRDPFIINVNSSSSNHIKNRIMEIKFESGKYSAIISGKKVTRTKREHLEYVIRKAESPASVLSASVPCEYSPSERFDFISKFVSLISSSLINSFILTGSGGIGKTTAVINTLKNTLKLKEDTPEDSEGSDFVVIRGFSTPRALYETLYEYSSRIIILDDADQVFRDPLGSNILKAALDDKPVRILNWNSSREDSSVPSRFTYTGRIIFISNLPITAFPQAILSRSQKVDLTLNTEEKLEVIARVFSEIKDESPEVLSDVLEFVRENAYLSKDLNIRSAVSLITLRREFGTSFKRIAKYSFSS